MAEGIYVLPMQDFINDVYCFIKRKIPITIERQKREVRFCLLFI